MQPDTKVKFGRVDLEVTAFGFGTAPIGNIFREIDEENLGRDDPGGLEHRRALL